MTNVTIFKNSGVIVGFVSKGHADGEDELGSVVCNGISSLTLTSILSLREIASISESCMEIEQENGYLVLRLEKDIADEIKAQTILQFLEVGLKAIQENYKKYMNLKIQEVNDDSF